ncbi:hypothetical protein ACIKP9_08720 [Methylobacillus methanolivorans]|uniref:DUF2497 domain-containing protein n=1 Tax=Methylobacillus methanolivorans TaxID=1848927 RepID=A0ABW8GMN1_9PROT
MSDQPQDELALVLRRIHALSGATAAPAPVAEDDVPVLTDVYAGHGALSAVEIEQLLAPYDANAEQAEPVPAAALAILAEGEQPQESGIKFLPADVDEDDGEFSDEPLFAQPETMHPQLLLARQELAEAVMTDMQPVIAQAIQDALVKEMQALTPKLSAEVEKALAHSLRERVVEALRKD